MKDFQRGKDCRTLESLPQTCANVAAEAVPAATPLRRACACLLYVVDESLCAVRAVHKWLGCSQILPYRMNLQQVT